MLERVNNGVEKMREEGETEQGDGGGGMTGLSCRGGEWYNIRKGKILQSLLEWSIF